MFHHKFGLVKKLIVVLLGMQLIDLSVLLVLLCTCCEEKIGGHLAHCKTHNVVFVFL